jgi:hypothetical protein
MAMVAIGERGLKANLQGKEGLNGRKPLMKIE